MKRQIIAAVLAMTLGGCASIVRGTSEEVMVNTNPAGANYAVTREGATIARINPTPAATTIQKTKRDITILCDLAGYQQATFIDHSGADNHYDSPVNITLVPVMAQSPQSPDGRAPAPAAIGRPGT